MELSERFEIHGANAARKFLTRHGIAEQQIMTAPGQQALGRRSADRRQISQ